MASEGPVGRGTSCIVTSSSFGATAVVAVGAQWALFGVDPKEREPAHQLSTLGEEAQVEGGANSPASWALADMRSTNWLVGGPTMANSSSLGPSHSMQTA